MPKKTLPTVKKPTLNISALERFKGLRGSPAKTLVAELTHLFLTTTTEKLSRMQERLRAKDFPAVENLAHALRSSSANLGLEAFSDVMLQIEEATRHTNEVTLKPLLSRGETEYQEAASALAGIEAGSW